MPDAAPIIHIREANGEDAPALSRTFDGLEGVDPRRARVWVAERGEHIVAAASAQRVDLRLDTRPLALAQLWTSPAQTAPRAAGVGPQLAAALRAGLERVGSIAGLYRLREPSQDPGGFALPHAAEYAVHIKVTRPLSLASKRGAWPALALRAASSLDTLAALPSRAPGWQPRRLPRARSFVELSLPEDAAALAELCTQGSPRRVLATRSARSFAARYQPGDTLLGLTHSGTIIAFVSYRVVRAGEVCVGELLELAARNDDPTLYAALLRAAERRLRAQEVELLVVLDGLGEGLRQATRAAGYRDSRERLRLEFGPLDLALPLDPQLRASCTRWSLGLLDRPRLLQTDSAPP